MLAVEHERSQTVLAQHRRIGGERFHYGARLEEIGRIEAECDAALEIDAAHVEEGFAVDLPAEIGLAQVVADILMAGEIETVFGAQVETSAIDERYAVAERVLQARVGKETLFPCRRRRRWRGQRERVAQCGDDHIVLHIEAPIGAGRRRRCLG